MNHKVHVAEAGETMYQISQKYGIKLKSLYRLNAMDKGNEPEEGQLIYLRRKKK
ncbi:MAG: LysM peptidoglycan-binding domain-containing protein [Bacteroidales bacterium]|nr:LysM peptidoglycan-binding domain-containing protein [Bacteroidales bacterium]